MSYFDIPSGISYDDWVDGLDEGKPLGYCHQCKTGLYPNDQIVYHSHLDYAFCSDTCFFVYYDASDTDTVESLDGSETTLIDLGIAEWFEQRGY